MKKAGILILAALMMIAMCLSVPADDEMQSYAECGIDMKDIPGSDDTQGLVVPYPLGAIDLDHHTYALAFFYVALPKEIAEVNLYRQDLTEEEKTELLNAECIFPLLLGTDATFESAKESYDSVYGDVFPLDAGAAREIGSADGYTFYAIPIQAEEYLSSIEEKYAEEYKKLEQAMLEEAGKAHFYAPDDPVKETPGQKLQFTTTDLDGNTVTSEELFSANKITMLNCWGIWCPNCMNEMEELAAIHTRIQEKGCGIVGLEWEKNQDEATYESAKEAMKEFGTNYPNVLLPEESLPWVNGFPATIFVDQEGTILSVPIFGAAVNQYEKVLDALLSGEEFPEADPSAVPESAGAAVYLVHVVDGDGPVEDATVQFCTDTSCSFKTTGEDGTVSFESLAGIDCNIHLLEAPDGYMEDDEEYYPDESGEVTITLQKEE